jgi:hypothetical protein
MCELGYKSAARRAETQPHKCLVSLRLSPSGRAALALCRLERVV